MKYPDGRPIAVGDLVWWNEGTCVGFVLEIIEEPTALQPLDSETPVLALSNLHPFDANQRKNPQMIGSPMTGGTTLYGEEQLEDEGVGPLTGHERSEFEWAIEHARAQVGDDLRNRAFCVCARLDMARREEDWHFYFVDEGGSVLETVVFPFRPHTRNNREPGEGGNSE